MVQQKEAEKGPSPEQRQDQSQRDRTTAALRKESQETQRRLSEEVAAHEETRATLKMLREQSQLGDNEEKRIKALAEREQKLTAREALARDTEKRASALLLHSEYGMPLDDLMGFDDARDMEIAALKYQKAQEKKAEPKEEEVTPARVDTGQATRTAPNWADYNMNTKEGKAAFDKAEAEETARRKRSQRATA